MDVYLNVCLCLGRALSHLELELQIVVRCHVGMGLEPWSARAASVLNRCAISRPSWLPLKPTWPPFLLAGVLHCISCRGERFPLESLTVMAIWGSPFVLPLLCILGPPGPVSLAGAGPRLSPLFSCWHASGTLSQIWYTAAIEWVVRTSPAWLASVSVWCGRPP